MNTIFNPTTVFHSSTGVPNIRQEIAAVIADGQVHTVSSIMQRTGTSYDGLRGRLSELRTRNGFLIDHSNGRVQFVGIAV